MASLSESGDMSRTDNPVVLKKVPSFNEDSKVRKDRKEKESSSRHASPKMLRRGRPTDVPPIQQELADRVKSEPFVKKFGLPSTETLIKDYSAALYKQIPLHGRMYISSNYICFESKIFNIKTTEVIPFKDITHIRKKSNKMKFSVGIHIDVGAITYHFASFVSRDKTFVLLHDLWRQVVPPHSDSSDPDEDDSEDDEEDVDMGKKQNSRTFDAGLVKQARSLPPSPRSSLRYNGDVLAEASSASLASLALASTVPIPLSASDLNGPSLSSSPADTSILESMGTVAPIVAATSADASSSPTSSTPPLAPATNATGTTETPDSAAPPASVPAPETGRTTPPPTELYYDDEHLSPGEGDDTEDGFLESEVFQNMLSREEKFDVSTLTFFRVFFSDRSNFIRKYHEKRGDKEISIPKWANSPQFGMIRNVQYYAPVKVPLGPDKTRVQETQRYVLQKNKLQIDTITVMFDIPYGDCFRLESKITVSSPSVTTNYCTLQVSLCVHFVKKTWFKGKIESQSIKELKESFKQWTEMAREELANPEVLERLAANNASLTNLLKSAPSTPPNAKAADTPATSAPPASAPHSAPVPALVTASSTSSDSTAGTPPTSHHHRPHVPPEQQTVHTATKDPRPSSAKFTKKLPSLPTPDTKSLYLFGFNIGPLVNAFSGGSSSGGANSDNQNAILKILVVFLSIFCIYLYCKISYLEGKFSVVENLLQGQLFDTYHQHHFHHHQPPPPVAVPPPVMNAPGAPL